MSDWNPSIARGAGRQTSGAWDTLSPNSPESQQPNRSKLRGNYEQENAQALPVNQRSAGRIITYTIGIPSNEEYEGNVVQLVPKSVGRQQVQLWTPTSNTGAVVYIGFSDDFFSIVAGVATFTTASVQLAKGLWPPLILNTEAALWVAGTPNDVVYVVEALG